MTNLFLRAYPPTQPAPGSAYWLPFYNGKLLVQQDRQHVALIQGGEEIRDILHPDTTLYLGTLEEGIYLTCEVQSEFSIPEGWVALTQRELFGRLDEQHSLLVGYATQLLDWQRTSRYCPSCGHTTEPIHGTWGRNCPNCDYTSYPPVTPAILVLVYDEDRMLLTHKPGWGKRYSCIAGFVEPGESLEGCVQREVYEEVGLHVTDIRYVGSQPWPFPHQLMVGYTARYAGGTLHIDQQELDDALWFRADALPEFPPPQSLARQIIEGWLASQKQF